MYMYLRSLQAGDLPCNAEGATEAVAQGKGFLAERGLVQTMNLLYDLPAKQAKSPLRIRSYARVSKLSFRCCDFLDAPEIRFLRNHISGL